MSSRELAAARRRELIRAQRGSEVKIRTAPVRDGDDDEYYDEVEEASVGGGDGGGGSSSAAAGAGGGAASSSSAAASSSSTNNNSGAGGGDASLLDCEEELERLKEELAQAKARAEKQRQLAKKLTAERDDLEKQLLETRNNAADQRLIAQEMKTATEHLKKFAEEAAAERDRLKMDARLAEKDDLLWKLQVTNKWS